MQTEIEAKFLCVNPDEIRERLMQAGAACKQPMQMMRRVVFDNELMINDNAFLRIRDEGHRISMTYKRYDEMSLTGAKEIEITVSDYDKALELVQAIGAKPRSIQEARREIWQLDDVEVVIDEWPWITSYVEIEGPTEQSVMDAAARLRFNWDDAAFGDIMTAYRNEYPHLGYEPADMIYNLPVVRHGDPLPDILVVVQDSDA